MSVTVINKEMLEKASSKQAINGAILMGAYEKKMTKSATPKPYIDGLAKAGIDIAVRVWDGVALKQMVEADYSGMVCYVQGSIDIYNGSKQLVITDISALEGIDESQFLETKYDVNAYVTALKKMLQANLRPQEMELLNKIVFNNADVYSKFTTEFCAMKYHDNCKSGLLAHTYKVVYWIINMLQMYPNLVVGQNNEEKARNRAVFILGAFLHDIGKIDEMHFGVYQDVSCVTHRILGLDYLFEHKQEIVEVLGDMGYRKLQSIIVQHDHTYGDKARTLYSLAVHYVDHLDAMFTNISESIVSGNVNSSSAGDSVFVDKDTIISL